MSHTEFDLVLREFLLAKEQAGCAPGTLLRYRQIAARFVRWLAGQNVAAPADLNGLTKREARLLVRRWGATVQRGNYTPSTIKGYFAAVKSFLAWCREERIIKRNLSQALVNPPEPPQILRTVFRADLTALLAASDESARGLRDAAMISLMIDTGLRSSEVARLRLRDAHLDFTIGGDVVHHVTIVVKGGREEVGVFGEATCARLRRWLAARPALARPDCEALFVSLSGNRPGTGLTRAGVQYIVGYCAKAAGIEHVTPHAFRRGFSVMMEELGHSSKTGALLGRWRSISSYERYTRAMSALQTARRINRFPADTVPVRENSQG